MQKLEALWKHLISLCKWLGNRDWVTISNLFTTIIAIVALFISSHEYKKTVDEDELTKRPYLSISSTSIGGSMAPDSTISLSISFLTQNYGTRTANDIYVVGKAMRQDVSSDISSQVPSNIFYHSADDLPPNIQIIVIYPFGKPLEKCDYFIKIWLKYKDVVSDSLYTDSLYYNFRYDRRNFLARNINTETMEYKFATRLDSIIYYRYKFTNPFDSTLFK